MELRHLHFLDEKDRPVVLDSHRAVINSDTATAIPLFFKALEPPLPKSPDDLRERKLDLFGPLKLDAESRVESYVDEMGPNAYALFNAVTDFATRAPALPQFRRAPHAMQTQAGRWLGEFDALLQRNPKADLAEYLGEYGGVALWN